MLKINHLIILGVFSVLASCSSSNLKVSSDYNKKADFSVLKTYNWYTERTPNKAVYEIMHERIVHSIDSHLINKGFTLDKKEPDFHVNYSVTSKDDFDINSHNTYSGYVDGWNWNNGFNDGFNDGFGGYGGYGYGYGFGSSYYGLGYNDVNMQQHTEYTTDKYKTGSLIIDIIDAKSDKIIFRGLGKERLPDNADSKQMDKIVNEAVLGILKNFPPH